MFLHLSIALLISVILTLLLYPKLIAFLLKIKYQQTTSEYSLDTYKEKVGTPTMGGILFVLIPVIVTVILFFNQLDNLKLWIIILAFLGYAVIGFIDDYIIVIQRDNRGIPAKVKFVIQIALAIIFYFIYQDSLLSTIAIPFTSIVIDFGIFYFLIVLLMFVGTTNAVNITDGMDGLAAGLSFLAIIPFLIFAIIQSEYAIAGLLIALIGGLIGYLRYNLHPAKIFMGDTGSLALGAVLAASALVLKQEIALIIIGGVFVYEVLCVIIQIGSVKLRKKRVFKYTPIHYSFIISGATEKQVVRCFWLAGLILSIIGVLIMIL